MRGWVVVDGPDVVAEGRHEIVEHFFQVGPVIDWGKGAGGGVGQHAGLVLVEWEVGGALGELGGDDALRCGGGGVGAVVGIIAQGRARAEGREMEVVTRRTVEDEGGVRPLAGKGREWAVAQTKAGEEGELRAGEPGIRKLEEAGEVAVAAGGDGGEFEGLDLLAVFGGEQGIGAAGGRSIGSEGETAAEHGGSP